MSTKEIQEQIVKTMRKWQDAGNQYIADHCTLSKEEIDEKISWREWWFSGEEAVDLGIATGFIE